MSGDDEILLLRVWTPRILRGSLAASAVLLSAGLAVLAATAPSLYTARYRELQQGHLFGKHESLAELLDEIAHGRPRALLVAGLLTLTMVPIARVAFAVAVFVRERDWPFAAVTLLVLLLLVAGIVLGHVG